MKKHLMVAAGLAVLSTSAFATKARLQALGQDGRASFYLDDTRSVFLNPAKLNSMNNFVVTEWGDADDTTDSEANTHAEGGFFRKGSSLAYGLYLGNEYGETNATRNTADSNFQKLDNNMDLFFAGDMGVQWGARVQYASTKNEPTGGVKTENDALGLGLGIIKNNVEAYANLLLKDESKGATVATDSFEADMGLNLGASYEMGDMTYYVDYDKSGYEYKNAGTKTNASETTDMTLGFAKIKEISKTAKVFFDLNYMTSKTEDSVAKTETKEKALPLTIGFETEATSWLTLRGSVSQNVVIGETETKGTGTSTNANSTTVNAGATMTFGKLMVDGVIGTTDGARNGTTIGTSASKDGVLATDNLMTRVAVHYWF
ncbi:MAG: hypothetical protein BM556_14095 [Bacteriovorax sp. MedPE-SWde]|nr:MAG: hypothetical protein BM556_14095 [Bacteriovorax sp. MedPE-SWde]